MRTIRSLPFLLALLALNAMPGGALAHAPSVTGADNTSPDRAVSLADPTLSRAIGATIGVPGEIDWFRMELRAGDPLVVGMTAPDAEGTLPASFVLLGPGLPEPALSGSRAADLAARVGATGALAFEPAATPDRQVHAGLAFLNYGEVRREAPADGTYWIAVFAVDPAGTGKYVLAPGVREEFGVDAVGGMADLVGFFAAPWQASGPEAPALREPDPVSSNGGAWTPGRGSTPVRL